jgi:antitoxin CptB
MSAAPETDPETELEIRRKRMKFQCWHRGIREMDLILGNFADKFLAELTEVELDDLSDLLDQSDPDVYQWIVGQSPVPPAFDTPVFARVQRLDFMDDPAAASGATRIKS